MESVETRLSQHLIWKLTDRHGGVSAAPFQSLNLAYHVGDEVCNVDRNRAILLNSLGLQHYNLVFMQQTHSSGVAIINDNTSTVPSIVHADAMLSDCHNVALLTMVADCNPIVLYDPAQDVFGVVHAGRKGIEKAILNVTLQKMRAYFNSKIADVIGFVGVSIRKCCYEVRSDVALEFIEATSHECVIKKGQMFFIDMITALQQQWTREGGNIDNLAIDQRCSACCDDFFSYRRERVCGRFGIIAAKRGVMNA